MNSTVKTSGRFSKSRGCGGACPLSHHHPLLRRAFALAPISARPECGETLFTGTHHHYHRQSLVVDLHVIVNWQLSKQGIRWTVSRAHIGRRLRARRGRIFFLKLTAHRVLVFDWIAGSSPVITPGEEEGFRANANFRRKSTPGALLTFLLTCSLHNRLVESPWYIAYVPCIRQLRPQHARLLKPSCPTETTR